MSQATNLYSNGVQTVQATAARFNKRLKNRGFKLVEESQELLEEGADGEDHKSLLEAANLKVEELTNSNAELIDTNSSLTEANAELTDSNKELLEQNHSLVEANQELTAKVAELEKRWSEHESEMQTKITDCVDTKVEQDVKNKVEEKPKTKAQQKQNKDK